MLSFKDFLTEAPILMDFDDDKFPTRPAVHGVDVPSVASTTPSGHSVAFRNHYSSIPSGAGGKINVKHVTIHATKDGKSHLRVKTVENQKGELEVTSLHAHENNTIKAHELYAHVVKNHFTLVSDTVQSLGGAKTWKRLHQEHPDVEVKVRQAGGVEHAPDEDWDKNYSGQSRTARFVARPRSG